MGKTVSPPSIALAKKIFMTVPSGGKCVIKQTPLSIAQSYLLIWCIWKTIWQYFKSLKNAHPLLPNNSPFWQVTKGIIQRKENCTCVKTHSIRGQKKWQFLFFEIFFFSSHVYPPDSPLGFVMLISAREPDVTTETATSYLSVQLKVDML